MALFSTASTRPLCGLKREFALVAATVRRSAARSAAKQTARLAKRAACHRSALFTRHQSEALG
jgi:hypothetical protein